MRRAHGLVELDMHAELDDSIRQVRELIAGTYMSYFECEIRILLAYTAWRSGTDAGNSIQATLQYAKERHFHFPNMLRYSFVLERLLAAALEAQIEIEYVRDLIAKYGLGPQRWISLHGHGR